MSPFASLFLIGLLFVQVPFSSENKEDKDNLDCSCIAHENFYRIIGGKNITGIGAFPWHVSIQRKKKWFWNRLSDDDKIALNLCGGVIVNALFVMTAAHCFYDKDWSKLHVGFGFYDLLEMYNLGSYREIQKITWPKDYDNKTDLHDIALVELVTPLKFSALVKPACLPTSDLVREYEGPLMITGWGWTVPPVYDKKHYLLNDPKRSRYLKVAYVQDRTQSTVCHEDKTQTICGFNRTRFTTDRGKPDIYPDLPCMGDSGERFKTGVSSTSSETFDEELGRFERCFRTNQFTRVSAHLDWIKSIVGNRPEQDYCSSMLVKKH